MNDLYDLNDWMNTYRETTGKEPTEGLTKFMRITCDLLTWMKQKGKESRGCQAPNQEDFENLAAKRLPEWMKEFAPVMGELTYQAYMDGYEGADAS